MPGAQPPGGDRLRDQLVLPALGLRRRPARRTTRSTRTRSRRRARTTRSPPSSAAACRTCPSPGRASTGESRCRGTPRRSSTSGSTRCSTTPPPSGLGRRAAVVGCHEVRVHVARGHPPGRQGHPALPRRDLAGDADGRRPAPARAGLRPRLAARGRGEDEQEQAHRHRPGADHRPLRRRCVPLLLPACDPVRQRRVVLVGGHGCPLHLRAGQRPGQPRIAGHGHGRQVLRRRAARPGRLRQRRPRAGRRPADGRAGCRRRLLEAGLHRRDRRGQGLRRRGQPLRHRAGAVGPGEACRRPGGARATGDGALHDV